MSEVTIAKTERGFSIAGEMSFATARQLLQSTASMAFNIQSMVEIDLARVSRADSAGLALVVEWMARARRARALIRFLNTPRQMRDIARVTELDALLGLAEETS